MYCTRLDPASVMFACPHTQYYVDEREWVSCGLWDGGLISQVYYMCRWMYMFMLICTVELLGGLNSQVYCR